MKNLIVDMFRRKNAKIKADSEKYKEEVAKVAKQSKQTQPEKTVIQEKEVMKESKTLMLD